MLPLLFADNTPIIDTYVQYGCFGLIVFIVVWLAWRGIPGSFSAFKDAHTEVVQLLRDEIMACRSERVAEAINQQKERQIVYDTLNKFYETQQNTKESS